MPALWSRLEDQLARARECGHLGGKVGAGPIKQGQQVVKLYRLLLDWDECSM